LEVEGARIEGNLIPLPEKSVAELHVRAILE
jgi:hypothetical protein